MKTSCSAWTVQAYLTRQDCRRLKKRKQKKHRTGFGTTEVRTTDLAVAPEPWEVLMLLMLGKCLVTDTPLRRLPGEPASPRTRS
eukprot:1793015-Amphidinium_carterae.1